MRWTEITPSYIAALLKLSEPKLWEFARNIEIGFRPRRMQLVGMKHRPIDPMHPWAKAYFRKLHRFIQKRGAGSLACSRWSLETLMFHEC